MQSLSARPGRGATAWRHCLPGRSGPGAGQCVLAAARGHRHARTMARRVRGRPARAMDQSRRAAMAPRDRAAAPAPHNLSGRVALQLGVVAVITALIPGIGDVLAAPVALASLVLGVVGYLRCDKGTATNPAQAIA